ncbi:MAG: glycine cleavage system aminomethyltransferase GcvT [Bacteroidales bacterium]|nr:glycine cleavage system aminomethyltransferase GcvT [Bacteroidales bacterium]
MKTTPFTQTHIALGARMQEFAGYHMPIEYSGILNEHDTVCQAVGVFDVSHMGEFWVEGPKALAFIQNICTNDASVLTDGQVQYSCLPNEHGGIVDDLLVYRINEKRYLMVVNASNIEKDWKWCQAHNTVGAKLLNASDKTAQLAVQGPQALATLQKLTDTDLSRIPYYHFCYGTLAGVENVLISNTGYTGAGGFEIYFAPADGEKIWQAVFEAGAEFGILPVGLGARDTLRLEMGFCLYGNDIDETTSPIEAGLGWITKFTEGKDFPSRAIFEKQKAEGVKKKLVGIEMVDKGIPRHDFDMVDTKGFVIGRVTSGTISPISRIGIALAYIDTAYAQPGTEVFVDIRNRHLKAKVVKLPFRK